MSGLLYCVCCLLAITISAQGDPWKLPWSNCGTSNDTAHVSSITIEPRPRIGYSHNVTVITSLGKKFEITGGNVTVTSKWMPKPHVEFVIDNEVLNLCDLLVELNHPCPLHPVNYVFIYQLTITSEIPKGMYEVHAFAKDQNGDEVLCFNANFTLSN